MKNKILKNILDKNPAANIATIGFFNNFPVEEFHIRNECALIVGTSDHRWVHLVGENEDDLAYLLEKHGNISPYFYSVEEWMLPLILKNREEDWRMPTLRYVLDPAVELPEAQQKTQKLDPEFAGFVHENSDYKDYTDQSYIRDRLQRGISAAIIKNGKPLAWGFTHDDGALGFLHVLPEYRKKGYGWDISLSLIAQKRAENKPVFCNIVPENKASISLTEKQGFEFDRRVYWVKLK